MSNRASVHGFWSSLVVASASALLASGAASAQLLSDDFADGVPGGNWSSNTTSTSLAVTEQNGRLECSAAPNALLTDWNGALYVGRTWQLRANAEVRVRARFRQIVTNTAATSANYGSEAGILVLLGNVAEPPLSGDIRPGTVIALSEYRQQSLARTRDITVSTLDSVGTLSELGSAYALLTNQSLFTNYDTGANYVIPNEGTMYLRYVPSTDTLFLSTTGYADPNAITIPNARNGLVTPIRFAIGGFARLPAVLSGSNAWWDDFVVDAGTLETGVKSLAASDGTFTNKVRLTWTVASGAVSYKIYRDGSTTPLTTLAATATSYDDLTAPVGVSTIYRVEAITNSGYPISVTDAGWRNLPAPTSLAASDGTSTTAVNLEWATVADAIGYRVWRATGTNAAVSIGTPETNTFTDTTAVAGTLYTYTVGARSLAGNSAPSPSNTGWRNLAAPTNVQATDGTLTTGVNITWTAVTGATGYRVLRAVGGAAESEIGTPTAASFSDTTAVAGTVYTYTVKTRSAAGDSSPSASDTGWRAPSAPTNVQATDGTLTSGVNVTWTAPSGATGYSVYRALGTATPTLVGETTGTNFSDNAVDAGVAYDYTVRAATSSGLSVPSAADSGWRNLPAPTIFEASDGSSTAGVNLEWSPVSGVTGYRVFRAVGSAAQTQIAQIAGATTVYTDTTATAGTVYTYSVRGYTAPGNTAASPSNTGWRNILPPASITASDGTSASFVNLAWSAASGATGYKVYRIEGDGTPDTLVATVTTTTYADPSVTAGTLYNYGVRAVTAAGLTPLSVTDTGWRNLAAPTNVVATDGNSGANVSVGWNVVAGATGYVVVRTAGSTEQTFEAAAAPFVDATAVPGTLYAYKVRAACSLGLSAPSTADNGWRNLPAPTNLLATDGTLTTGVSLAWDAVPGVTGYRVFRNVGSGTPNQIAQVAAGTTTYLDNTAIAGTTYTYRVRGYTTPGNTEPSNADNGWRNLAAPTGLAASDGTFATGVNVTWNAVGGATGYRVYRSQDGGEASLIASPSASPYLDATAIPGVVYGYFVKSRSASGDSVGQSNTDNGYSNIPAPTGLNATDGTSTSGVALTWNAAFGATEYRVYRSGTTAPIGVAAGTTFTDVPPAVGTVYSYTVRAFTSQGSLLSPASAANTGWMNAPAPTSVAATDGTRTDGVNITWTAPSPASGVTGYRVFRSSGASAPTQIAAPGASASAYLDATATAGVAYTYSVRAATAAGNSEPSADGGWRDANAATNLQASDGTSTAHVAVTWGAVTGASGYVVYRGIAADDLSELTSTVSASLNDATATPGTKYFYAVAAQMPAGLSTRRSTPPNDGWRNVPAPTGVQASDGTSTSSVTVAWNAVANATGYRVYRGVGTAAPTVELANINDGGSTSYVDSTAVPGTPYSYALKAKVAAPGNSAMSAANTGFASVPAPATLSATDGTSSVNVTITWSVSAPATGLTGYRIYRSGTTAALATVGPATLTYNDTTGAGGQLYTYTVKSVFAAGESPSGASDTGWRNVGAPANVLATDGTLCSKVRITWTVSTNPNVTGYRVLRAIGGAEPTEIGLTGVVGLFDDTTIPLGTTGAYTVQARTEYGNSASSAANTGFPKACFTGDDPSGDLPPGGGDDGSPAGGSKKDGGDTIGGDADSDGTDDTAQPDDGGDTDPTVREVPACAEACARIRAMLAQLALDQSPDAQALATALRSLLDPSVDASGESPAGPDGATADAGSSACAMLAGDVNLDGVIDAADLAEFLSAWAVVDLARGDLDRDGRIDEFDLSILLARIAGAQAGNASSGSGVD